jgi:hypothetical protein
MSKIITLSILSKTNKKTKKEQRGKRKKKSQIVILALAMVQQVSEREINGMLNHSRYIVDQASWTRKSERASEGAASK